VLPGDEPCASGAIQATDGKRHAKPGGARAIAVELPDEQEVGMPETIVVSALDEAWRNAEKATSNLANDLPANAIAAATTSTAWATSAVLSWQADRSSGRAPSAERVIDLRTPLAGSGAAPVDPAELRAMALAEARRHAEKASAYLAANAAELAHAAAEVANAWGQLSLLAAQMNR
jgi:hypothetical protein